jgi:dienelactone hydrolase
MSEHRDALEGFTRSGFTAEGKARDVYRIGSGPAVVVISEMPGITPRVADFGRIVGREGFTAVLPHLFGEPGRPPSPGYILRSISWGCVAREFTTMATRRTSPVTTWLRALARSLHEELGGPGVGVVGMCFTGGFALAMMVDDTVLAPVLSQPSLPFPVGRARRRDLGISDGDLARVKQRVDDGVCVLGLRFTCDPAAPADRFQRLRDELGDGFVGVEIDSSPGNPWGLKKGAHSVLTEELKEDDPAHPTCAALDQVLDLFRTRLRPG